MQKQARQLQAREADVVMMQTYEVDLTVPRLEASPPIFTHGSSAAASRSMRSVPGWLWKRWR
eukprot:1279-Eustigmatos_ZCMA.PRE.1